MDAKNLIVGIILLMGMTGCEKNVSLDLHTSAQQLVVDGKIESGQAPVVVLTRSQDLFTRIDTTILKRLFVHGAKVTVTGGGVSVTLVEVSVDTLQGNKYYYYTVDSADQRKLIGRPGGTYELHITVDGKDYDASTTIPSGGFRLDSVWWLWGVKDEKPDTTEAFLMARIVDPPALGNYARYFTKCNDEPFYPGLSSVADDEITNGTTFDFQIDRGVDKNEKVDFNKYGYFNRGDRVTLKFCNIDKDTYQFWQTWEYAWSNQGNPFSTPTTVVGNVPGALGYWGGYQTQYKTITIPE
jgi:hypothetical protein